MRNTRIGLNTLAAAAAIMAAGAWCPGPEINSPPQPAGPKHSHHKGKTSHKQNARRAKKGSKR